MRRSLASTALRTARAIKLVLTERRKPLSSLMHEDFLIHRRFLAPNRPSTGSWRPAASRRDAAWR